MKGYIYVSSTGTDSFAGKYLNDPIFGDPPTLGACIPNIRRLVLPGDKVYVITGSVAGVQQYVVGGFEVDEKIDALMAFKKFPDYRLRIDDRGSRTGNIIVTNDGAQHPLDDHKKFAERLENYLVGKSAVELTSPREVEVARQQTLMILQRLFQRHGNRVVDVLGRWRRMNEEQINQLDAWMAKIKADARQ